MLNIATENICKCPADDPAGGREIKMEPLKRKDLEKYTKASEQIINILKENDFNYEEIKKVLSKVEYEINHRSYIRD